MIDWLVNIPRTYTDLAVSLSIGIGFLIAACKAYETKLGGDRPTEANVPMLASCRAIEARASETPMGGDFFGRTAKDLLPGARIYTERLRRKHDSHLGDDPGGRPKPHKRAWLWDALCHWQHIADHFRYGHRFGPKLISKGSIHG